MPERRPARSSADAARRRAVAERRRRSAPTATAAPAIEGPVRLNRFLARAGVASRREADDLIAAGRVAVNGEVVSELGRRVSESDRVTLDGRAVSPRGPVYILLNKPKDAITTTDDERGRRTVMDLLRLDADESAGTFPVGRLDRDTQGALLVTNDGDLAHRLMHPRYTVEKLYVVRTERPVTAEEVERLRRGVALEDGRAKADQAGFVGADQNVIALAVHEGRNRLVRRMFEALGHEVVELDRVRYGGLTLEGLRRGRWRRLEPHEINALRRSVKLKEILFERPARGAAAHSRGNTGPRRRR
jgi:23S rRNA pseudouridine2605 synthase